MCECSSSYHDINTYDTHNLFKATVCQHLWLAVKPSERSNVETIRFPQASHGWKKIDISLSGTWTNATI